MNQSPTWWYLARASGLVAWALLSLATVWGLLLSTRALGRAVKPKWITDLHRFLGGIALVFTACHIGFLVADSYVHFGRADVLVPFAAGWKPAAVAWGVVSFWLLIAIESTSMLMRRLPRRLWRAVHFSSFALFVTATVHALTAGTDAKSSAFLVVTAVGVSTVGLLTAIRVAAAREQPKVARRGDQSPVRATAPRAASPTAEPHARARVSSSANR